jgi:DNA mismatch repair protein MutL
MEFPSSFSQNDSIAKSMAKSLAVKTGTALTVKAGELGEWSFACKEPNVSPFQKPTFITMRVEDLDKNLQYEKCNRNGKTINYN